MLPQPLSLSPLLDREIGMNVPVEIVKNELYGTVIRFESPFYKYTLSLLSNAIVRNVNY